MQVISACPKTAPKVDIEGTAQDAAIIDYKLPNCREPEVEKGENKLIKKKKGVMLFMNIIFSPFKK